MDFVVFLAIGADFSFFFLGQRTNSFFSPLPIPLEVGRLNTANRGSEERCKLPQWGLGWSRSRQTIWCILESKSVALVVAVFVDFPKNKCNFLHKTSSISYGGSNSSQGGALWGVFLLGQSPPLPYGSRCLCFALWWPGALHETITFLFVTMPNIDRCKKISHWQTQQ